MNHSNYYSTSLTRSPLELVYTALYSPESFFLKNNCIFEIRKDTRTRGQETQFSSLNHTNNDDLRTEFLNTVTHLFTHCYSLSSQWGIFFISTNNYCRLIIMCDIVLSVRITKIFMVWSFILQNFQQAVLTDDY